ncbi:acyl-CoA carboxylase subunit epsilon [Actinokineospora globicatena]|uniref:acyl-CoA carboxylase subunit epsilon n=1 Tax=Actinokineospora globicatena TaxID=103729 RepID=UPI0020A4B03D|nr:acyl-CoA carboxylase subunit epsilon [Actinokineospora globicatena]MCP2302061.1 Acyl-CoA carboxylase epsilon subunit [Actinokineospora globicatena]
MSPEPVLRVVRGNPDAAELAALTVVVAAAASAPAEPPAPLSTSAWSDKSSLVRRPLPHGPGAWRSSGLPR